MDITQKMKLDITPGGHRQVLHVTQYDSGQTIKIQVVDENNDIFKNPDITFSVEGTRPDNYGFEKKAKANDGVIEFEITDQMTLIPGNVNAQIVAADDSENRITILDFFINVAPSALLKETPLAESDNSMTMQEITESINELSKSVSKKVDIDSLSNVANTGDFEDLSNVPDFVIRGKTGITNNPVTVIPDSTGGSKIMGLGNALNDIFNKIKLLDEKVSGNK